MRDILKIVQKSEAKSPPDMPKPCCQKNTTNERQCGVGTALYTAQRRFLCPQTPRPSRRAPPRLHSQCPDCVSAANARTLKQRMLDAYSAPGDATWPLRFDPAFSKKETSKVRWGARTAVPPRSGITGTCMWHTAWPIRWTRPPGAPTSATTLSAATPRRHLLPPGSRYHPRGLGSP